MTIRNTIFAGCMLLAAVDSASAQRGYRPMYPLEVGLQVGTCHFLGDLGGQPGIGRPFIRDTDIKLMRPALGLFARYNFGGHFAARIDASFLQVAGDDKLASRGLDAGVKSEDGAWFRYYRNLSFRSRIFEATIAGEIVPYNFELGGGYQGYSILSPYATVGIGVFNFKPQTQYNGTWVDLQPLRTEGQGFVSGRVPYSLTQMNIPVGFGIKWTYNDTWALGLEVNHRITFTDYIDDVSTDYVSEQVFLDNFDPATAQMAIDLFRRSDEHGTGSQYSYITATGEQRGDPKDNDSYYTITVRFSYFLDPGSMGGGRRYGCPVW